MRQNKRTNTQIVVITTIETVRAAVPAPVRKKIMINVFTAMACNPKVRDNTTISATKLTRVARATPVSPIC